MAEVYKALVLWLGAAILAEVLDRLRDKLSS
jgi:hypothetical protein